MVRASDTIQLEGTWEDILQRAGEFAGRHVRVTVYPRNVSGKSLDQVLKPLIEQAASIRRNPNPPKLKGISEEFSEAVADQLRKQGLKL